MLDVLLVRTLQSDINATSMNLMNMISKMNMVNMIRRRKKHKKSECEEKLLQKCEYDEEHEE